MGTEIFLPMFYLAVFSNIGLADCEKSIFSDTTITVVVHRYQALSTRRRARGQRLALVEYCA